MDLPRAILGEAQRLHRTEQRKLMMDTMCAMEVVFKSKEEASNMRMGRTYICQRTRNTCVLLFEYARGSVVECTRATLAGLACDWAQLRSTDNESVHVQLVKLNEWDATSKEFKEEAHLLDHRLSDADEFDATYVEEECLAVLDHFAEVVAALRPAIESPWA